MWPCKGCILVRSVCDYLRSDFGRDIDKCKFPLLLSKYVAEMLRNYKIIHNSQSVMIVNLWNCRCDCEFRLVVTGSGFVYYYTYSSQVMLVNLGTVGVTVSSG